MAVSGRWCRRRRRRRTTIVDRNSTKTENSNWIIFQIWQLQCSTVVTELTWKFKIRVQIPLRLSKAAQCVNVAHFKIWSAINWTLGLLNDLQNRALLMQNMNRFGWDRTYVGAAFWILIFSKWAIHALFLLFFYTIKLKSWRQARWPLGHFHGPLYALWIFLKLTHT